LRHGFSQAITAATIRPARPFFSIFGARNQFACDACYLICLLIFACFPHGEFGRKLARFNGSDGGTGFSPHYGNVHCREERLIWFFAAEFSLAKTGETICKLSGRIFCFVSAG
jgi:hypothetical protein